MVRSKEIGEQRRCHLTHFLEIFVLKVWRSIVDCVPNLNIRNRAEALYIDVLKVCKQANFHAALANLNNLAYS